MNKIKYRLFTFASLIFIVTVQLIAGNGGSGYSRFGIGDIRSGYSAQTMGMSNTGLSILSGTYINSSNPAAWTKIIRTRYTVGALYEGYSSSDGTSSTFLSSAEFNGAMIAIPVSPRNGIVLATGLTPYSKVNYNILSSYSQSNLDYTLRYRGEGGLTQAHLGISGTVDNVVHLGVKLNYYFGTLRHTVLQEFSMSQYSNAEVIRSTQLRGTGFTFGTVYSGLSSLMNLSENESFTIGGFISTPTNLSAEREDYFSYTGGGVTTRDTSTMISGETRLPVAFGIGISYGGERMLFGADVLYQNWNAYTEYGVDVPETRDSYRYSVGAEVLPKRDITAPFTQRIAYRLGAFYHQTYYQIQNKPINELGFSGGAGIPVFGDTRLHIAAEYAFRGTTDKQLQKDNILRLSFTLSGGELWFVRPAEE